MILLHLTKMACKVLKEVWNEVLPKQSFFNLRSLLRIQNIVDCENAFNGTSLRIYPSIIPGLAQKNRVSLDIVKRHQPKPVFHPQYFTELYHSLSFYQVAHHKMNIAS